MQWGGAGAGGNAVARSAGYGNQQLSIIAGGRITISGLAGNRISCEGGTGADASAPSAASGGGGGGLVCLISNVEILFDLVANQTITVRGGAGGWGDGVNYKSGGGGGGGAVILIAPSIRATSGTIANHCYLIAGQPGDGSTGANNAGGGGGSFGVGGNQVTYSAGAGTLSQIIIPPQSML